MKFPLITLLSLTALGAAADDIYTPVLALIERNSLSMQAYTQQASAARIEARTGLAPADPQVELGYLWGSPGEIGKRKDVSVSQEFDFPTAYRSRRQLADAQQRLADDALAMSRTDLLLSAKKLLVELIYTNSCLAVDSLRLAGARSAATTCARMLELGETTILEDNKASLALSEAEARLAATRLEQRRLLGQLAVLNGGVPVEFDVTQYPPVVLPDTAALADNPALRRLDRLAEADARRVGVARAEGLPSFSVGYQGEFVPGSTFQGVTLGLSIPLWENRRRVEAARANAVASAMLADDARRQYEVSQRHLYEEILQLRATVAHYEQALAATSSLTMLHLALDKGEISYLDYVTELDYYYQIVENLLATRRDLHIALATYTAANL